MLKIGNLTVESNYLLAPMSGVTDYPYREIVKRFKKMQSLNRNSKNYKLQNCITRSVTVRSKVLRIYQYSKTFSAVVIALFISFLIRYIPLFSKLPIIDKIKIEPLNQTFCVLKEYLPQVLYLFFL